MAGLNDSSSEDVGLRTTQSPLNATIISSTSVNSNLNLFVYRTLILIVATVGAAANGLVAVIFVQSKQLKKENFNLLFLNQMVLDLYSCVMLTVVQVLSLLKLNLEGAGGYWLCMMILDEMWLWIGLNGSTANLVVIAVERYIKIVHPVWHKNHFKPWMTYATMAFCWIDGIALNVPLLATSTDLVGKKCLPYAHWISDQAAYIYDIWYFVYFFVIPLFIFTYCYGRILAILRHRATVISTKNRTACSTAFIQTSQRAQLNVIKTTLTVTITFIVCWLPNVTYYLLTIVTQLWDMRIYFVTMFFAFLSICLNPFVYAGQYDLVKTHLYGCLLVLLPRRHVADASEPNQLSTVSTIPVVPCGPIRVLRIKPVSLRFRPDACRCV